MTEQQYRVIADAAESASNDALHTLWSTDDQAAVQEAVDALREIADRIERPVPTTNLQESTKSEDRAPGFLGSPHPPTREQIADAIGVADNEWMNDVHPNSTDRDWRLHLADAVLALIQNGADR